jgi:hypothetical protein
MVEDSLPSALTRAAFASLRRMLPPIARPTTESATRIGSPVCEIPRVLAGPVGAHRSRLTIRHPLCFVHGVLRSAVLTCTRGHSSNARTLHLAATHPGGPRCPNVAVDFVAAHALFTADARRREGPGHQFELKMPGVDLQTEPRARLSGYHICFGGAPQGGSVSL